MKKVASISILIVCLVLPVKYMAQGGGVLREPKSDTPEGVVRGFYRWYLRNLNNDNFNPLKQRASALTYISPQLLAKAPRLTRDMGADIFICAQDFDPEWQRNISLSQSRTQGAQASMLVTLRGSEMSSKIKISLKRLNPGWRIDVVECVFD